MPLSSAQLDFVGDMDSDVTDAERADETRTFEEGFPGGSNASVFAARSI
jgi:hypothetical protein